MRISENGEQSRLSFRSTISNILHGRFVMGIIICAIVKHLLTVNLPIFAIGYSGNDDALMVRLANSLLNNKWLDAYNNTTLVKGAFFPALLAAFNFVGISYIDGITWLYTLSCIFFICSIKPLFKSRKSLFVIYLALLFNPISFSVSSLQRVYRNGVTLFQALFVFGGLIGTYLRRGQAGRSLIKWLITAGISLAALWHTREDGIWIIPFVIAVTAVLIGSAVLSSRRDRKKLQWKKCISFLIPLLLLFGSNQVISFINYQVYGIYSNNEINSGSFGDAIKAIYSVKNEEDVQYVTVTREKLQRLYEVSPTLKSIEDWLENCMNSRDTDDRSPGDGEVEDGWFFWALRDAAAQAGYHSDAITASDFYGKITEEIRTAIDEGLLESQSTMPSPLMSPWRAGYASELLNAVGETIYFAAGFNESTAGNYVSLTANDGSDILLFEAITNNYAIYPPNNINLAGWYVYLGSDDDVTFVIEDGDGNVIEELENALSPDVSESLKAQGIENVNAENCRFMTEFELQDGALFFAVYNSKGELIDKIDLYGASSESNETHIYFFDENSLLGNVRQEYSQKYVDRANLVSGIYQAVNKPVAVLSLMCYVFLIVLTVRKRKSGDSRYWCLFLILSGILCSLLVLFIGIGYTHISAFASIHSMYLSGCYPLLLAFEWIAICAAAEALVAMKKGAFKGENSFIDKDNNTLLGG